MWADGNDQHGVWPRRLGACCCCCAAIAAAAVASSCPIEGTEG